MAADLLIGMIYKIPKSQMPVKPQEFDWVSRMKTVGYPLPAMPLPVFEELDYLTDESISFTEEPYVEDFLEIKFVK